MSSARTRTTLSPAYLLHTASHLTTSTTLFGAIYLLSHGATKIVLVVLVLREKLWAYPWLIVLLLAFIAYQLYRITAVHFSVGLTALTVFDAVLVWLTWREYQSKKARRHPARTTSGRRRRRPRPPAIATTRPPSCSCLIASTLPAGSTPAITSPMPTAAAAARAARSLSPVSSTGCRPMPRSRLTASADVGLTVSATASRPRTRPSQPANTTVWVAV